MLSKTVFVSAFAYIAFSILAANVINKISSTQARIFSVSKTFPLMVVKYPAIVFSHHKLLSYRAVMHSFFHLANTKKFWVDKFSSALKKFIQFYFSCKIDENRHCKYLIVFVFVYTAP